MTMEETTQNYTEFFSELYHKFADSTIDYRLIANYSNKEGADKVWEYHVQPSDTDYRCITLHLVNNFTQDPIKISGGNIISIDFDDWGYTIKLKNGYTLDLEIYQRISPDSLEDDLEEELDPGDDPMPNW